MNRPTAAPWVRADVYRLWKRSFRAAKNTPSLLFVRDGLNQDFWFATDASATELAEFLSYAHRSDPGIRTLLLGSWVPQTLPFLDDRWAGFSIGYPVDAFTEGVVL